MQQPTNRHAADQPVHVRVFAAVVTFFRGLAAPITAPQMNFAGTAPTTTVHRRSDHDTGRLAGIMTPLTAMTATFRRWRDGTASDGIDTATTNIHFRHDDTGMGSNGITQRSGTHGLAPTATSAIHQT